MTWHRLGDVLDEVLLEAVRKASAREAEEPPADRVDDPPNDRDPEEVSP